MYLPKRRLALLAIAVLALATTLSLLYFQNRPTDEKQITVFGEDSSNLQSYALLKDEFFSRTGIRARFDGATFEQAVQKADADFRSGSGALDIVLQYNFSLAPYVRNSYVADINETFGTSSNQISSLNKGMFENAVRETCYYYSNPRDSSSAPKQFALPFAANTMVLAFNRDLFDDVELKTRFKAQFGQDLLPPSTWPDYLAVAEFFNKIRPDLNGVCMQGAGDGWLYYELCNYLFSMGTGTSLKNYGWEETTKLTISTPENVEALSYYKRLQATSSGDFFTVGASQQQEILLRGKTAMALVWSDYLRPLAASKTPHFGFTTIPGVKSGLAGGAFYINAKSKHMTYAASFVKYALDPENQSKLVEKGLCSPLKAAYTPLVMKNVPYAKALYESLDRGIFMFEAGTDAEVINTAMTTAVQKFIRGETTASKALENAQQEVLLKRQQSN